MINRRHSLSMLGAAALAAIATKAPAADPKAGPAAAAPRTYILVHGAGSGGWAWRRVLPHLLAAGHRVYTPTLTGLGERSHLLRPDTGLDTHVEDVVAMMCYEDLTNVILAGHSYGGMVITGAADRALDRIAQMVYLDAAHPRNGQSLADVAPAVVGAAKKELRTVNGVEVIGGTDVPSFTGRKFADAEIALWRRTKTSPMPWKAIVQPLHLTNEAAIRKIPRTNINCTPSIKGLPADAAQFDGDRNWEIDTTHDLQLTEPKKVAEMLLRLASL